MRVDLLGYLLGALDDPEHRRVEEAIRRDPYLQRAVEALKEQLAALDELAPADDDPPAGLAEHTCEAVDAFREVEARLPADGHPPADARPRWTRRRGAAHEQPAGVGSWSVADSFVAAGIFLVAAMLLFPALAQSRYQSNVVTCQHNLQQLGQSLVSYSDTRGGFFPAIPVGGNRGVAGIYAPILFHNGYVVEPRLLVCPSSRLARRFSEWSVPTLSELDEARGLRLVVLQRNMGGSYGYTLGYREDGHYRPVRNAGRRDYALLSDSPSLHLPGLQSSNHGGRGQNVLYEDGHVVFVTDSCGTLLSDALFLNRLGFVEAGVDWLDSVIGDSLAVPLREE